MLFDKMQVTLETEHYEEPDIIELPLRSYTIDALIEALGIGSRRLRALCVVELKDKPKILWENREHFVFSDTFVIDRLKVMVTVDYCDHSDLSDYADNRERRPDEQGYL